MNIPSFPSKNVTTRRRRKVAVRLYRNCKETARSPSEFHRGRFENLQMRIWDARESQGQGSSARS